jgi:murein DD-endopeptidase MepM/ murein hydrolase activator NlpD
VSDWLRGTSVDWANGVVRGGPFQDNIDALVTSLYGPREPIQIRPPSALYPDGVYTGYIDSSGVRRDFHYGVDLWPSGYGDGVGAPLLALGYGEVSWAQYGTDLGNAVEVRSVYWPLTPDRIRVQYFHMLQPATVTAGQRVEPGQILGYVDTTGAASGPHLHIAIYVNDYAQNPLAILAQANPVGFVPLRQLTGAPGHFTPDGGYVDEWGNVSPGA